MLAGAWRVSCARLILSGRRRAPWIGKGTGTDGLARDTKRKRYAAAEGLSISHSFANNARSLESNRNAIQSVYLALLPSQYYLSCAFRPGTSIAGRARRIGRRCRMATLLIGSVLLGAVLGRFFKVLFLVPTCALVLAAVLVASADVDHGLLRPPL